VVERGANGGVWVHLRAGEDVPPGEIFLGHRDDPWYAAPKGVLHIGMRSRGRRLRRRFVSAVLIVGLVVFGARATLAYPTGIASTSLTASGCNQCHSGGVTPVVLLDGPLVVSPGDTVTYTLTIFGNPAQNYGGLNVAASGGVLSLGGSFMSGTKTVTGASGFAEITHTQPKQGDLLNQIEYSFRWTAPASFGTVTLRGWGNAVDGSGGLDGDAAALSTLLVTSLGLGNASATPTASPTATPTPIPCGDVAPPNPPPVADNDARACQAAIAKVGSGYVKKALKAAQQCLSAYQAGGMAGDPLARCVGTVDTPPADSKAQALVQKAQEKLHALLTAKCSASALANLDACASTEVELEPCVLAAHQQAIAAALAAEFGGLIPNGDRAVQRCQSAIAAGAAAYLNAYLAAADRCVMANAAAGDAAARCFGSLTGATLVPPTDARVATAITKAEAKLKTLVARKCPNGELAPLDACGKTTAEATACLLCTHRTTVLNLLGSEFGGTP
jgi:hypothetical protein